MQTIRSWNNFLTFHDGPILLPLKNCPMNVPYKVSWILTLREVISIRMLPMRIISAIMKFYWSHAIGLQKLSNEHSYKFSWILTLIEVIRIRILHMRIISTFKNYYLSHAIALQKLSHERSKFSWISTLTEVISIRILRMRIISAIVNFIGLMLLPFKNCQMNVVISLAEFQL